MSRSFQDLFEFMILVLVTTHAIGDPDSLLRTSCSMQSDLNIEERLDTNNIFSNKIV